MDWSLLLQLTLNGLIVGALYGVVAMSFVLIYKASQVVNFAQGEFLLVGAWVCWWLLTDWQLPFWAGFLFTLAFMTLFGIKVVPTIHCVLWTKYRWHPTLFQRVVQSLNGWFFGGGTVTESGEEVAWDIIRIKLKEIVEKEDKNDPLSDDALVDELAKLGYNLARRTVTKYRKALDIPSSRQRRAY